MRGIIVAGLVFLLNACVSYQQPGFDYTAFKESHPRSILVLPPVNLSPDIMAPATFLATSIKPLAESGYYVIPVALSEQTFRQNGITVAEEAHAINPFMLYEIFGADAGLYITITRYGVNYLLISSEVEAAASARLVDLRTGQQLWHGDVSVKLNRNDNSDDGLFAMLVFAVVDQIVNTLSDKAYDAGKEANNKLLSAGRNRGILYGPYHEKYKND
jgi:hypothetical protein